MDICKRVFKTHGLKEINQTECITLISSLKEWMLKYTMKEELVKSDIQKEF